MKNIFKYIFVGFFVILILLVAFVNLPAGIKSIFYNGSKEDSYSEAVKLINNKFSTDVIVYGENIEYRNEFKYRNISDISREKIYENYDRVDYIFLIINDLHGESGLSNEEIIILKELLKNKEKQLSLIYFGRDKLNEMSNLGIFDCNDNYNFTLNDFKDTDNGFSINNENNQLIPTLGFWTLDNMKTLNENHEYLALSSLFVIESILKENN